MYSATQSCHLAPLTATGSVSWLPRALQICYSDYEEKIIRGFLRKIFLKTPILIKNGLYPIIFQTIEKVLNWQLGSRLSPSVEKVHTSFYLKASQMNVKLS